MPRDAKSLGQGCCARHGRRRVLSSSGEPLCSRPRTVRAGILRSVAKRCASTARTGVLSQESTRTFRCRGRLSTGGWLRLATATPPPPHARGRRPVAAHQLDALRNAVSEVLAEPPCAREVDARAWTTEIVAPVVALAVGSRFARSTVERRPRAFGFRKTRKGHAVDGERVPAHWRLRAVAPKSGDDGT